MDKEYTVYYEIKRGGHEWTEFMKVKAKNQKDAKAVVGKTVKALTGSHAFHLRFKLEQDLCDCSNPKERKFRLYISEK